MLINEHDEKLSSSRKGFLGRLSKYIGRKKSKKTKQKVVFVSTSFRFTFSFSPFVSRERVFIVYIFYSLFCLFFCRLITICCLRMSRSSVRFSFRCRYWGALFTRSSPGFSTEQRASHKHTFNIARQMRYKLWYFDVVLMVFLVFSLPLEGAALWATFTNVSQRVFFTSFRLTPKSEKFSFLS